LKQLSGSFTQHLQAWADGGKRYQPAPVYGFYEFFILAQ